MLSQRWLQGSLAPPASSLEAFGSGLQVVCHMYSAFGAVQLQWVLSQWLWLSGQRLSLCLQSHPPQEPFGPSRAELFKSTFDLPVASVPLLP